MSGFDVLAASQRLLTREPSIIVRLDMLPLVGFWVLVFFVVDGVLLFGLPMVLSSNRNWETRVKIREALVSCVHDIITVPLVFTLLNAISHVEDGPGGLLGVGPLAHIPMALIDQSGCVFIGFLLWDSLHYLTHGALGSQPRTQHMIARCVTHFFAGASAHAHSSHLRQVDVRESAAPCGLLDHDLPQPRHGEPSRHAPFCAGGPPVCAI